MDTIEYFWSSNTAGNVDSRIFYGNTWLSYSFIVGGDRGKSHCILDQIDFVMTKKGDHTTGENVIVQIFSGSSGTPINDCIASGIVHSSQVLSQSYDIISSFDSPSSAPYGVGVDSNDCIWVVDNGKVYKLRASDGFPLLSWNTPSSSPLGLGIDSNDCIWNTDLNAKKIYQCNQAGVVQSSFASPSSSPYGIDCDSNDCIWNADFDSDKIYKLNQAGTKISSWDAPGSLPFGLGIDSNDCIWNVNTSTDKIIKLYMRDGSVILSCGSPDSLPHGIGFDSNDCIWHSDATADKIYQLRYIPPNKVEFLSDEFKINGSNKEVRLQFNQEYCFVFSIGHNGGTSDRYYEIITKKESGFTTDPYPNGFHQSSMNAGTTWGTATDNYDAYFWAKGIYVPARVTTYSGATNETTSGAVLWGMVTRYSGTCYIYWDTKDWGKTTVGWRYSSNIGDYNDSGTRDILSWDTPGTWPQGVGVDSNDCIWHTDQVIGKIYQSCASDGSVVSSFASPSSGPMGLGIDSNGCIWSADNGPAIDKIYKLRASDGSKILSWAAPGTYPQGVGVDSNDCIWHADATADKIYKINQAGVVQSNFASPCSLPTGVEVDSNGCIWSADRGTSKIYKSRASDGSVVSIFASPSSQPRGVGIDSNDCIWHADSVADKIYKSSRDKPSGQTFYTNVTNLNYGKYYYRCRLVNTNLDSEYGDVWSE